MSKALCCSKKKKSYNFAQKMHLKTMRMTATEPASQASECLCQPSSRRHLTDLEAKQFYTCLLHRTRNQSSPTKSLLSLFFLSSPPSSPPPSWPLPHKEAPQVTSSSPLLPSQLGPPTPTPLPSTHIPSHSKLFDTEG